MPRHSSIKPTMIIAAASLMVSFAVSPLQAHLPPTGPPQYAAYGAFTLCSVNFSIEIRGDEALHIRGDIARVIGPENIIAIKYGGLGSDKFNLGKLYELSGSEKVRFARFTFETPDSGQTLSYAPEALEKDDIRYAILSEPEARPALIIGSNAFDGTQRDKTLLERVVVSRQVRGDDCVDLERALRDREYGAAVEKQDFLADIFPSNAEVGPAFHCIDGIGFEVKPGETLRRPWKPLRREGPIMVETGGNLVRIEGSGTRLEKVDRQSAHEHPIGLLQNTSIIYYPSRGIGPPYAAEGVRDPGSWEVMLNANGLRGLQIRFNASGSTNDGFSFLERLKFVEPDDVRCRRAGN